MMASCLLGLSPYPPCLPREVASPCRWSSSVSSCLSWGGQMNTSTRRTHRRDMFVCQSCRSSSRTSGCRLPCTSGIYTPEMKRHRPRRSARRSRRPDRRSSQTSRDHTGRRCFLGEYTHRAKPGRGSSSRAERQIYSSSTRATSIRAIWVGLPADVARRIDVSADICIRIIAERSGSPAALLAGGIERDTCS